VYEVRLRRHSGVVLNLTVARNMARTLGVQGHKTYCYQATFDLYSSKTVIFLTDSYPNMMATE